MTIENKNLGINSDDVYDCKDKETLLNWKIGVAETLYNIWEKLKNARAEKEETGHYADREWYTKADTARRLQEILLFQIEHRLEQLK